MVSDKAPDSASDSDSDDNQPNKPRWLRRLVLASLTALILLAATGGWLLGTQSGARTALSALPSLTAGMMRADGIQGRLAGPLQIDRLTIDSRTQGLVLTGLQLDWQPLALVRGMLHVSSLRLTKLAITNRLQQEPTPTRLPERIDAPLRVQLDRVRIDSGEFNMGPVNLARFGTLIINADYDGSRYRLGLDQFTAQAATGSDTFAATFSGQATVSTTKPYALQARIDSNAQALIQDKKIGATGHINLAGSLAEMITTIDLAVASGRLTGSASLRPFSDQPLASADIHAQAIDLSMLVAGMPQTGLDLTLAADATGAGILSLRNTEAGLLNDNKVPLTDLSVTFQQEAGHLAVNQLQATLGTRQQVAGIITGNGRLADGAVTLEVATQTLNLRRLDARLQSTQLAGTVDVRHAAGAQDITLDLHEPLNRKTTLALSAHARLADNSVVIDRATLRLGQGQVTMSARVDLAQTQTFRAEGRVTRLHLQDLGQFAQLPRLDLNGHFSLSGARQPQLLADLVFQITDSQLAGQALRGDGTVQLRADSLLIPNLLLAAGNNRITANGALSPAKGNVQFDIAAPNLVQLGIGFGGALNASGTVTGSFTQPRLMAQWRATQLTLPGKWQVETTDGKVELAIDRSKPLLFNTLTLDASARGIQSPAATLASTTAHLQFSPQANAPMTLELRASGIAATGYAANTALVTANGTTARHTLALTLTEPSQNWNIAASGGLQDLATAPQWQGSIDRFDASGRLVARLAAPAPLLVSPQKVQLDRFRVEATSASVAIDQFLRDPSGIATRGRFSQLKVADILAFVGPQPALSTDLQLRGEWDVKLGDAITGAVKVERQGGDVTMRGNVPVVLGLRTLTTTLTATNGRLTVQGAADGAQLGQIALNASASLTQNSAQGGANRFMLTPDAAVSGNATIDIPSLRWIAPFVSPSLIAEGRLHSAVALGGTFGQPVLSGQITGSELRLFLTDLGLDLRQGTLDTEFRDTQLLVKQLRFRTGQGSLSASGPIGFSGGQPTATIALVADKFALLDRSDRRLVLSGTSQVDWRAGQAKVTGQLGIDAGAFDIGQQDAPQLSDDVVVVGRTKKSAPATAVTLDLGIDLRDGVALKGRGINANLVGQFKIQTAAGEALRAQGTLRTASGTFSAYGRELVIEQGLFRFDGPLNNPALDILAMRRSQEVEAGVAVRGNVLAPRITLVSEPTVPDAEKLSWLVLGRGLDAVGSSDLGALQSAAGALLSEGAAAGVQSQIATAFGLDDFRIGNSQNSVQSRIVTLGKKISTRLYVSYEQGLESASNVVHLRYTLTPRLTLEAEAGTRSALSLFYNVMFD